MVEKGFLEAAGQRSRQYYLGARIYQLQGKAGDFVRMRGIGPARQDALVVEFAEVHGQVTRGEVAELLGISPEAAKVRLKRLTQAGKLAMVGETKGAQYVPLEGRRPVPVAGKALIELIRPLLEELGEASLQEIEDGLKERGIEIAGNNKRNYLTGMMSRNKDLFEGLGRGRYRLIGQNTSAEDSDGN